MYTHMQPNLCAAFKKGNSIILLKQSPFSQFIKIISSVVDALFYVNIDVSHLEFKKYLSMIKRTAPPIQRQTRVVFSFSVITSLITQTELLN